jgi:hypothetical protein
MSGSLRWAKPGVWQRGQSVIRAFIALTAYAPKRDILPRRAHCFCNGFVIILIADFLRNIVFLTVSHCIVRDAHPKLFRVNLADTQLVEYRHR